MSEWARYASFKQSKRTNEPASCVDKYAVQKQMLLAWCVWLHYFESHTMHLIWFLFIHTKCNRHFRLDLGPWPNRYKWYNQISLFMNVHTVYRETQAHTHTHTFSRNLQCTRYVHLKCGQLWNGMRATAQCHVERVYAQRQQ